MKYSNLTLVIIILFMIVSIVSIVASINFLGFNLGIIISSSLILFLALVTIVVIYLKK